MKKSDRKVKLKSLIILTAVMFLFIVPLIIAFFRASNTPEEVLEDFYEAVYISSNLDDMKHSLIEDYRYYFEQAVTMAGMEETYYDTYREKAIELLGEKFTITIKITDKEPTKDKHLIELREKYIGISASYNIAYDIFFSGESVDKKYSNTLEMVKIGRKWYMTTHLDLPIGTNTYAY